MKAFTTTLFTFCIGFLTMAQTYTGTVIDTQKQPISFANIVAKNTTDNTLITGVISDENGKFSINPKKENFYLEISFVGFSTQKITPNTTNLGTIILQEDGNELEEVVITARKKVIQQKVDRLVFNVENTVAGSGGTALDALKVTPSVNVDSDKLEIIGKGEVKVMINDRMVQLSGEELVNYLSSIASDDIKNIEVITTPPSKYDAEGNSGLINIQLKKTKENSWSNQIRSSYTQGTYPVVQVGNTFNYSHNKLRLLASLNGKKGNENSIVTTKIDYPNQFWNNVLTAKTKQDMISGRLGIDYNITNNASIGVLYAGTFSNQSVDDTVKSSITNNNVEIGTINSIGFNNKKGAKNHSLNAHYIQKLDTLGRKLSVDFDYFDYKNPQDRIFESERTGNVNSFIKNNNISKQHIKNYSGKIDITHPSKWANFSYGGKITTTNTKSLVDFYDLVSGSSVFDSTKSDNFKYTENIQALYVDMAKPLGKKWQTKLGLRWENTQTKGVSASNNEVNKRSYSTLFPTVFVSYMKSNSNIFNFSYSKRINRPGFWALNPFKWYLSESSYVEGNPFLQPQISDNFELKHIYKNRFISEIFVNYMSNGFGQAITVDANSNEQIYSQSNFYKGFTYGFKETVMYNPVKWWKTTSQGALYTMKREYDNNVDLGSEILEGWNFQFYTNHNFNLNTEKTISAEATFMYSSPMTFMVFQSDSFYWLNLGLKMLFLDKKLQLTLSANDIFKSRATNYTTYNKGIKQVFNTYSDSQNFKIGLSYRFGNSKIKVRERSSGNKDEQNRAKN